MKHLALAVLCCTANADNSFPLEHGDPSVLLVKRKGPANAVAEFHRAHGGKVTRFRHIPWDAVEVRASAFGHYKASPLFQRVEFQRTYSVDTTPNDPMFGQQWALPRIEAAAAWDKATSNDVIVAVIDTGIDCSHPDLKANLWTGPQGEHGYTAWNGVITNGGRDDHYHGTHVAGTIAAVGNNGLGVAGVNWRAKVISFKFLSAGGSGSTRDAILCIEKMIDLKQAGHNIRVSNNSWGALGGSDPALEEAFQEAADNGILNVCAAGNNGIDIDTFSFTPAGFPLDGIVSVLASTESDGKASFSNFGVVNTDIFAPGQNILSCKTNGGYWLLSGTSMASPHVAGAMAMVFAFNPGLMPEQAKTILLQPESYDRIGFALNSTGGGRLNLRQLWNNPAIGDPPPPNHSPVLTLNVSTNFVIIPTGSSITLTASGTDADGHSLSYHTTATAFRDNWWPEVWWERPHFAFNHATNQITVSTLPLALDQLVRLRFSAVDGHGGGQARNQSVWSFRDESKIKDIGRGIRSFATWFDASNRFWFRLEVDTNIVPVTARYDVEIRPQPSPWSWDGEPNKDVLTQMRFPSAGAYAARPFLIDRDGNFVTGPRAQIIVSNSAQRAPEARLTLNTKRGVAPLTVIGDLSASQPGSVTRLQYGVKGWRSSSFNADVFNPVRTFTLTEPGVYELLFYCADTVTTLEDRIVEFITVLPAMPAKLTASLLANGLRLSWQGGGILQESASVTGPWTDSASQANPQLRMPVASRFFKLR